jgi:hypothetical protein
MPAKVAATSAATKPKIPTASATLMGFRPLDIDIPGMDIPGMDKPDMSIPGIDIGLPLAEGFVGALTDGEPAIGMPGMGASLPPVGVSVSTGAGWAGAAAPGAASSIQRTMVPSS